MQPTLVKKLVTGIALAIAAMATTSASAAILITEVDSAGSAASYAADWFELTNTGAVAVDITGWKMDDNSNSFSAAVALRGVTSIGAGQSVVFLEGNTTGTNDASINANFKSAWFGSNVPSSLVIGNYGGSGVGLSQTADAVHIFNASGTAIAGVDFGASASGVSFDNAVGFNNVVISTASVSGINGAFTAPDGQIGSPGVAPVPEPESYALMLGGLAILSSIARRKRSSRG